MKTINKDVLNEVDAYHKDIHHLVFILHMYKTRRRLIYTTKSDGPNLLKSITICLLLRALT